MILSFIRKNPVLLVAFVAALVTAFFVPIDATYITYFDFKTLSCLFCVLAVVCALKEIRFFYVLARSIVRCFGNARLCVLVLVYITFIGSMLIANDMALLTFLPLGYFVLTATDTTRYMAFTFIMQNIAANLGGMLTPFGNPQNLYLYTKFSIPNTTFLSIMAPPFIVAILLITLCCLFVPKTPMQIPEEKVSLPKKRTALYLILFALSIVIVFRGVSHWVGLIVIVSVLLLAAPEALMKVDYPLLFTFVFFFIFSGNMARIEEVRVLFSSLLQENTLLFSIFSCQFISNVPSAILLSQFTEEYAELLVGVNIGGVGTPISSLASLITLREYMKVNPGKGKYYMGLFLLFNALFLILLTAFMLIWKRV